MNDLLGLLGHHVEPAGSEKGGQDVNVEILFGRPAIAYASHIADVALRPRLHLGSSINVNGNTNQLYAGFTWDIPLMQRVSLELTFGGSLHDGPNTGEGSAFGCPLNFRKVGLDWDCRNGTLASLRHHSPHVECRPLRPQQRPHQRRPPPGLRVRLKKCHCLRPRPERASAQSRGLAVAQPARRHGRFGISNPRCTAGRARPRSSQAGTCFRASKPTRSRAP